MNTFSAHAYIFNLITPLARPHYGDSVTTVSSAPRSELLLARVSLHTGKPSATSWNPYLLGCRRIPVHFCVIHISTLTGSLSERLAASSQTSLHEG